MASRGLPLVFLTILSCITLAHSACSEEEPKNDPSDTMPDLNMTVLPGLVAHVGDELKIICVADKPRYQFLQGTRPKVPNRVNVAFDNGNVGKRCLKNGGRIECVLTVPLNKTSNSVSVACNAANDNGCRTFTVFVKILEKNNQKTSQPKLLETPSSKLMVLTSSSVKTMPFSSSAANINFTSSMASEKSTLQMTSSQTSISSGGPGRKSESSLEDEEELDDVKKLITATLVLVITMLLLMIVAIIYVLQVIKN